MTTTNTILLIALSGTAMWAILQHLYIKAIEQSRDGWRRLTYRALQLKKVDTADLMSAEKDIWDDVC